MNHWIALCIFILGGIAAAATIRLYRDIARWRRQRRVFGDGRDGDVVIASPAALTRDMQYNNARIIMGGVLHTNGCRVFVKGTLTIEAGGTLVDDGGLQAADIVVATDVYARKAVPS